MPKNDYLLISTCYSFVCGYKSLIRSRSYIKVTHEGQDQIEVIYAGSLHLNQMRSCSSTHVKNTKIEANGIE